jgi:hypothetical protein
MLKNWSDEAFNASLPRFIASSLSTIYMSMQKSPKKGQNSPTLMYRQRRRCFSALLRKLRKIMNFLGNCHRDSSLHCFYSLIFFFVNALRQWWQIWEAMKWWNCYYGKKLKQWSNEAFNTGKEIEAMKRLTLHPIASSLHRFYCPALLMCIPQDICTDPLFPAWIWP